MSSPSWTPGGRPSSRAVPQLQPLPPAGKLAVDGGGPLPQALDKVGPEPHPGGTGVHHLLRGGETGGFGGRQGLPYSKWEINMIQSKIPVGDDH